MSDLISRQQAIEALYGCTDVYINNLPVLVDKADAIATIRNLPSTHPPIPTEDLHREKEQAYMQGYEDGRKPRKGKWINPKREGCQTWDKKAYAQCSECGAKEYIGWGKNFCPNCGAMMEEGGEE